MAGTAGTTHTTKLFELIPEDFTRLQEKTLILIETSPRGYVDMTRNLQNLAFASLAEAVITPEVLALAQSIVNRAGNPAQAQTPAPGEIRKRKPMSAAHKKTLSIKARKRAATMRAEKAKASRAAA